MGEQDRMHALLQARAVTNEMEPEAGPFALGADLWVGQPDRRHEIAARQLCEQPGVDPVGLAGQRRQPFHLDRVGDCNVPTGLLELVVDKAGAIHRLDRRPHRLGETSDASGKAAKTVSVGRRGTDLDPLSQLSEQAEVETLAAEIQSRVQHCVGPPFVSRGRAEHDSAGGPPSSHSFAMDASLKSALAGVTLRR
jgi:hypothetical protein